MIIPSLDLFNGKIVRLHKGNYQKIKFYNKNIFEILEEYQLKEINTIHIVDLNGADNPNSRQCNLIKLVIKKSKKPIQIGGGIRHTSDIEQLLSEGAKRVVIGSSSITQEKKLKNWFVKYGGSAIVLALDLKINNNNFKEIYINAWKTPSGITLEQLIHQYSEFGLKNVLCTDISKDGTLIGPNIHLYQEITELFPHIHFQSSGGIGQLSDIYALKQTNIKSIIIGKALLENKFSLSEAVKCWQNA